MNTIKEAEKSVDIKLYLTDNKWQYFIFTDKGCLSDENKITISRHMEKIRDYLNSHDDIDELELPVRARNVLRALDITFISELTQKTASELLKEPNLGRKSIQEIKNCLKDIGLSLKE